MTTVTAKITAAGLAELDLTAAYTVAPVVSAGGVPYASLAGASFVAKMAAAGAQVVDLPAGVYDFSDFGQSTEYGLYLPSCKGIVGAGPLTVIEMVPNSSTKTAPTTTGSTNGFSLLRLGAANLLLQDFTLQGTPQKNIYNGLRLQGCIAAVLRRVKIVAIPGSNHFPPGETFGLNSYDCVGQVWDTVEADGAGVGASGLATNSFSGGLVSTDCYAHDWKYSAGVALWEHDGDSTFTRFRTENNLTGVSMERTTGTFTFDQPTFGGNSQDFFFGNDRSPSCELVVNDPIFTGGQTKVKVSVHPLEQNAKNQITRNNVHVLVGGVDKTGSMVQWT